MIDGFYMFIVSNTRTAEWSTFHILQTNPSSLILSTDKDNPTADRSDYLVSWPIISSITLYPLIPLYLSILNCPVSLPQLVPSKAYQRMKYPFFSVPNFIYHSFTFYLKSTNLVPHFCLLLLPYWKYLSMHDAHPQPIDKSLPSYINDTNYFLKLSNPSSPLSLPTSLWQKLMSLPCTPVSPTPLPLFPGTFL